MLTALSISGPMALKALPQLAEESITEDELATAGGTSWAGSGLPFSELTNIEETLVREVVGRIVIDRYGAQGSRSRGRGFFSQLSSFLANPFGYPYPGKKVIISMWGSKYEGCFAELIFQTAPSGQINDAAAITPVNMEMGVNGQIIRLSANANNAIARYRDYTYTVYEDGENNERQGRWYMGRQVFPLDFNTALVLMNAPAEKVRARVTFANNTTEIYEIGEDTVRLWRSAFSFNPACRDSTSDPLPQAAPPRSPAPAPVAVPVPRNTFAAPAAPPSPIGAPPVPDVLLQARGVLDDSAPIIPADGSRYQEHTFRGRAGQTVTIMMSSPAFDTYLILLDPDGQRLAQNDDVSEGNTNSQITIQLPVTGVYRVLANSYDSTGRGDYQIMVR